MQVHANRAQFLFVTVPGLLAAGLFLSALSSTDRSPRPTTNEVLVRPGDRGCVTKAMGGTDITEVREVILPDLGLDPTEGATTAKVRAALLEHYGSNVTELEIPMHYEWVWDPVTDTFVLVCRSAHTFEIDFGELGSIVVESRDTKYVTHLD